jgi:hypothetical protein
MLLRWRSNRHSASSYQPISNLRKPAHYLGSAPRESGREILPVSGSRIALEANNGCHERSLTGRGNREVRKALWIDPLQVSVGRVRYASARAAERTRGSAPEQASRQPVYPKYRKRALKLGRKWD